MQQRHNLWPAPPTPLFPADPRSIGIETPAALAQKLSLRLQSSKMTIKLK